MLDEHALAFGDALEEVVKVLFVGGEQLSQHGLLAVLELDIFRKFLQFQFDAE